MNHGIDGAVVHVADRGVDCGVSKEDMRTVMEFIRPLEGLPTTMALVIAPVAVSEALLLLSLVDEHGSRMEECLLASLPATSAAAAAAAAASVTADLDESGMGMDSEMRDSDLVFSPDPVRRASPHLRRLLRLLGLEAARINESLGGYSVGLPACPYPFLARRLLLRTLMSAYLHTLESLDTRSALVAAPVAVAVDGAAVAAAVRAEYLLELRFVHQCLQPILAPDSSAAHVLAGSVMEEGSAKRQEQGQGQGRDEAMQAVAELRRDVELLLLVLQ